MPRTKKPPAPRRRSSDDPPRKWPAETILDTLTVYVELGELLRETERQTGIPEGTIRGWLKSPKGRDLLTQLRATYRARMLDEMGSRAASFSALAARIARRGVGVLDGQVEAKNIGLELSHLGRAARDFGDVAMRMAEASGGPASREITVVVQKTAGVEERPQPVEDAAEA